MLGVSVLMLEYIGLPDAYGLLVRDTWGSVGSKRKKRILQMWGGCRGFCLAGYDSGY